MYKQIFTNKNNYFLLNCRLNCSELVALAWEGVILLFQSVGIEKKNVFSVTFSLVWGSTSWFSGPTFAALHCLIGLWKFSFGSIFCSRITRSLIILNAIVSLACTLLSSKESHFRSFRIFVIENFVKSSFWGNCLLQILLHYVVPFLNSYCISERWVPSNMKHIQLLVGHKLNMLCILLNLVQNASFSLTCSILL